MPRPAPNTLRWDGRPGHNEVYYVTLTDAASGVGAWIRYTMTSPGERIGDAVLTDGSAVGGFDDVAWDVRWGPSGRPYAHVHALVERLGLAQTVLELPRADLAIEGTITYAGTRLELVGARGGQAHLWGSKHADNWAWAHCNDLRDTAGEPVRGAFVDAVSVRVRRGGRELGPLTPVVGRFDDTDFPSTSPLRAR